MNQANHLINEKSPYLLQHAHNPVDWYPWGREAFEKAKNEDKPILVSIGYSSCHWCHVMEEESFSNPEIAQTMNRVLVNIKVDREELPDLDKIYMTAVQAISGSGGWPLNVFLTPSLKPFYGGTYFPPQDRWGRMGWIKLIEAIGRTWQDPDEREKIVQTSQEITHSIAQYLTREFKPQDLEVSLMQDAFFSFMDDFDSVNGGFGGAPKFPMPVNNEFLMCYHLLALAEGRKEEAEKSLEMALAALRSMAKGGISDQIGGGFHRYSTDEFWHIPHFEKMLYDNSQIAVNFIHAFQLTRDPIYEKTARSILDYLMRDMTHPLGGFYSAEDADSPDPATGKKSEGAFYLWTKKEIHECLGEKEGEIFSYRYGAEENGNARSDPQGEFEEKNILFQAHSANETAVRFGMQEPETEWQLERSKQILLAARNKRSRPGKDDKIITSWNGLAISAFAVASQVLQDQKYLDAAENAARFLRANLYDPNSRQLYRRWREGERKFMGIADDYAFLAQGLLDLYEACFKQEYMAWAIELADECSARFWDAQNGGFFMTDIKSDSYIILRVKEEVDNVEPSANSVAALNALRFARFTNRPEWSGIAEQTLKCFAPKAVQVPRSLPIMLQALYFALCSPKEMIVAGEFQSEKTQKLLNAIRSRFMPNKAVALVDPTDASRDISRLFPFFKNYPMMNGQPAAYVCVNYECKLPAANADELDRLLTV